MACSDARLNDVFISSATIIGAGFSFCIWPLTMLENPKHNTSKIFPHLIICHASHFLYLIILQNKGSTKNEKTKKTTLHPVYIFICYLDLY